MKTLWLTALAVVVYFTVPSSYSSQLSHPQAESTAVYAANKYQNEAIDTLAQMIHFKTVANEQVAYDNNPEFTGFRQLLKQQADALGINFEDHGYVLLFSVGAGERQLTLITHGDVQPANPAKWASSPFELDTTSEPGRLIGRGTEDDKGAIAAALYALKAIKDKNIALKGKVELMVYMAEESNWDPLREFLKTYQPAPLNIALDSDYPVVIAEKAWSHIQVKFPKVLHERTANAPILNSVKGGAFRSQIPEEAIAEAQFLNQEHKAIIRMKLERSPVAFQLTDIGNTTLISVKGKAAHSSTPQDGVNAIAYLAHALGKLPWANNENSAAIRYLHDLVGTGFKGDEFGQLAYSHPFMGPMTLSPTMAGVNDKGELEVFINIRRPLGKSVQQVTDDINQTLQQWQQASKQKLDVVSVYVGEPLMVENAPHVPALLKVFEHFTDIQNPQPKSIGGSTNAKLFPNAVSFGPSMPGTEYTGHSEHEFMTRDQFVLTIKMYTAAIIEIAGKH